jgi:DNA-binding NarL/FixJ family response regulator
VAGEPGQAAARQVRARPSAPQVIVLTTFDTDQDVLHALRAGASGFLLKDTLPAEISQAVRKVAAGYTLL